MDEQSFGERYARVDDADASSLLDYLDDVASIPAVAAAKLAATAALGLQAGARALEVGSGTGVDLPALAAAVQPGGSVVGTDPSTAAVQVAQARMAATSEVEVVVARAESLPFADATFDAVRADRTLQHVTDIETTLTELRRVLRRGGRLVVLEFRAGLQSVGSDPDTTHTITERLFSTGDQAWIPLMLPLLLPRAGFGEVAFHQSQATTSDPRHAEAALRLRAAVGEAVRDGSLAPEMADHWLSELATAGAAGTLELEMAFVRVVATAV